MNSYERALGAFYGLALGDALGMPTQSLSRQRIAELYGTVDTLLPARPEQPIAPGLPAGSITDDTEQAVLLARLLIDGGGQIDPTVFAKALLDWESEMIRRGSADLLGPSTKRALEELNAGVGPEETGRFGTTNGAAMRITPVAIATPPRLAPMLDAVVATSRVTHNTNIGIAAAAAVATAVSSSIEGTEPKAALDSAELAATHGAGLGVWRAGADIAARLHWVRKLVRGMGTAELVETIAELVGTSVAAQESVIAAFALAEARGEEPQQALCLAAQLGGDTDTIAAICGAILGARHGVAGLPRELVETVREVNDLELEPLVTGLLKVREEADERRRDRR
ncbi:ADP-ribosylglycohydrolase family protein [Sciscionella marina]|uniref:ADP-ribosylglycohydrolase family protein n=1 Tax=Sciscionella marina TaxID=508770 RepID=UPI00036BDDE8|nr:ADP-ribosylglycohydrolase family protein [Sciscionella marina]